MFSILVNLPEASALAAFRDGAADAPNIIGVGLPYQSFMCMGGIDAQYLGLTSAERWGSKPLPAGVVDLIPTPRVDQENGLAPYILTGVVLDRETDDTPDFVVRLLAHAIKDRIRTSAVRIRTIGFNEDLWMTGKDRFELGRQFAKWFGR